ncbi:heavy metal translocating P-type ATPase [Paenibacillus sp. sptzw28]|uniref:heavy metal translocating P-type ATPase n=1 Tax=Paenibacillus sp. sptzw28 TaxID=715179 RepID=UPI001C6E9E4E|nr:heavy metal translocating P-type ATPase [Paenibacillus sp. sptzw28]QYR19692.1 heavy metal translocating P-type ATPase [Paenibacillus sp. sptzw28]
MTEHPGADVLDLRIQGMSCTACASRIEKAIGKMKGVLGITVHYAGKSANIQYAPDVITPAGIIERIGQLGFQAVPFGRAQSGLSEMASLRLRVIVSVLLTLPLLWPMAHHFTFMRGIPVPLALQEPLLQFALASIVQFFIGMPFYFNAYFALRERTANMDVLVAVGTTAAFGYSYYAMMKGLPLYFETSAVVIAAVLLGKLLEASAAERVMHENEAFTMLLAKDAVVVRGVLRERIPVERIRPGELLLAEPGVPVPADGIVIEGDASVDESLLTGESMPIAKGAGDYVYAGTIVHDSGMLIRAAAVGGGTMLSRIAALTRQAQSTKSSIGRKVDRLAAVFVPTMLGLSAGTLLLWLLVIKPGDAGAAAVHALAVLLAACPCALGLAAPISLVLASGKLARRGIVLKEAEALERLAQLDIIVLDKTGTLTEGRPALTGISAACGSPSSLLRLAAAAEAGARHPFALAIMDAARRRRIDVPEATAFKSELGKGIHAKVEGKRVELGNSRYAAEQGWEPSRMTSMFAADKEKSGETVIYAAVDGECAGAFSFADSVKSSSPKAVRALQKAGISVLLATGDHTCAAEHAARAAGISVVHAGMLPEDKTELIRRLQREGRVVGMAGDGWNDAPALAAADVGIAMASSMDAALSAGHITLLRPGLTGICEALSISRLTVRNIRQNLGFAFMYNAIVIPFAAFGGLRPWMAGTAMALSSVSVVCNALRLNRQMRRVLQDKGN